MSNDLASRLGPIKPWNIPQHDQPLTQKQIDAFWRDGFLIGVPVLNQSDVDAIRADIEEISDPAHEGREYWYEYNSDPAKTGGLLHGIGGWRVRQSLHDLLWHPTILGAAQQILRTPVRLVFDQLFCKPAHQHGLVSWHQDYSYLTYSQPMSHLTCWIALDDADLTNGCVQYVPGSHAWNVLLPRPSRLTKGQDDIFQHLSESQREHFVPVPAEVKAGSALFHHPLTVHGSLPNDSDRPRRGTTISLMSDGTRAAVDEPTIDGIPAWLLSGEGPMYPLVDEPEGPVLGGTYFPLLTVTV